MRKKFMPIPSLPGFPRFKWLIAVTVIISIVLFIVGINMHGRINEDLNFCNFVLNNPSPIKATYEEDIATLKSLTSKKIPAHYFMMSGYLILIFVVIILFKVNALASKREQVLPEQVK